MNMEDVLKKFGYEKDDENNIFIYFRDSKGIRVLKSQIDVYELIKMINYALSGDDGK